MSVIGSNPFGGSLNSVFDTINTTRSIVFNKILSSQKTIKINLNNISKCSVCPLLGLGDDKFDVCDENNNVIDSLCEYCLKQLRIKNTKYEIEIEIIKALQQLADHDKFMNQLNNEIQKQQTKKFNVVMEEYKELQSQFNEMVKTLTFLNKNQQNVIMDKITEILRADTLKKKEKIGRS